ncbi:MAG TPA: RNA-binding S4 domain-containing protein [Trichocoleus sp.]|jgi:ribosome-associated protein
MSSNEPMSPVIKLDQFLKLINVVETGGEAKMLIQNGEVQVNGAVETRRGRKLVLGDRVQLMGRTFAVKLAEK